MHLDEETQSHVIQLKEAIRENRLVVFVGAGVSASAGVPTWQALIDNLKLDLPKNMTRSNDMLKIAQMYRELRGEVEYQKEIKKILRQGQVGCNEIHKAIMELNPCHIVTTNYDDLLEQAALLYNKRYYVVAKDEHLPSNQGERMIIKMHGDFREGNIVLTENDYYDYSRNFPLIRAFLLSLFATKVVLFVGFSFDDINLKYILREISSILDSKMQRIYLLVNQKKSLIEYTYFQSKGIQLLCLDSDYSSKDVSSLEEKSTALYQSLSLLREDIPSNIDLITMVLNFFEKYDEQINFWGEYLDRIFPKDKCSGFQIRQGTLYLPNDYRDRFNTLVKTRYNQKLILKKYGKKLKNLFDTLIDNQVERIEDYSIVNEKRKAIRDSKYWNSATSIVYSLDFERIEIRLRELNGRSLRYTIEDLELPFILFKLGKYFDAYVEYERLAPEMWSHRKYILYFICLYNIKLIKGRALSEISHRRDIDIEKIRKRIDSINTYEILSDLPMETRAKSMLEDLATGSAILNRTVESVNLNEEISSQREIVDRGGMSINSNIAILLDNFDQLFFFSNRNYILNECHPYIFKTCKYMAEGILNSLMTKSDEDGLTTRLDKLYFTQVYLFVFMVKPGNLTKMFQRLVNKPILVDNQFSRALEQIIKNMAIESKNPHEMMSPSQLADYLRNIILILNRMDRLPIIDDIYTPIIKYWYIGRFVEFAPELIKLQKRQSPSAKEAITIIDCVLHSRTIVLAKNLEDYVSTLANIAKEGGEVLDDFISIEQITELKNNVLISAFYWAIPERYRQELIDYLREHVDCLFELCEMENLTGVHIITSELIRKLRDVVDKKCFHRYFHIEALTCANLLRIANNEEYSELNEAIADFRSINKCYQFMSSPQEFRDRDEIQGSWLLYIKDEDLAVLLEDKKIRSIAEKFCEEMPWNVHFKERVWNLMK